MVPPTLPTAAATRCSSAAPATVTVGPSRNGVPGRSAESRRVAARPAALQLVEQIGGLRQRALVIEDVGDREARGRQQSAGNGEIEHDRDQRRVRQRARNGLPVLMVAD